MASAYARRQEALRTALLKAHLDGLLVSGLANVRYLTGFSGSNALLLMTARDALLLTDFRYQTQAADEVGSSATIQVESTSLWNGLWTFLQQRAGIETLGFESMYLLHRDFERLLDKGRRWQWRPMVDVVETLREQKDADEIDAIRDAAQVGKAALSRTLSQVRAGMTELDVCGILEHSLRADGSEAHPFPPIVAAGERSALPHARPSRRPIALGEFLLLDFGATVGGYCSDITRTVVVGRASERQRELYAAVRQANETARAGVRAGMTGRDADALARNVLEAAGLGDAFGHSLGHGIGLEVHEAPRLSRVADGVLPVGAVVTIEPGAYVPEWGGVRIEDDVVLQVDGAGLLTDIPRDLIELS
ncbi:MAG: Xaa-Pro peptidase family protein [Gemmatimonadaceae bacterium]